MMKNLSRPRSLAGGGCKLWLAICSLLLISSCTSSSPGLNSYTQAVGAADEGAAIQTIRTIATAQEQYRATHGDYGTFDTLTKAGILDARFASDAPTLRGYRFTMNQDGSTFTINADPQATANQPAIGSHHYYFDSKDGITRANSKQAASASDPPQQQQ
jgi:Tfp pilus assembly protein PilE